MTQLLDRYNEELRFLRQEGALFAQENPQVAARLGLHADAVTDPFVERLLEGVAFLSARVHARMDRECAEFAEQALARVGPAFCNVTPSMTTFSFFPDYSSPESQRGRTIPKGSIILGQTPGSPQPVKFVTGRKVELLPLRLAQAECSRSVSGLPSAAALHLVKTSAVIRLQFEIEANTNLGDLAKVLTGQPSGLEPLTITIGGDAPLAFGLHHVLLAEAEQIHLVASDDRRSHVVTLPSTALRLPALDDDHALLPADIGGLPGIRLLREYLAQPSNFLGLELHGLIELAKRCPQARSFEVLVGLRTQPQLLMGRVTPAMFHLFATPVINLYARRLDPVHYDAGASSQWLLVDRMKPNAYHLFALTAVSAVSGQGHVMKLAPVMGGLSFEDAVPPGHYGLGRHRISGASARSNDPMASHDRLAVSLPAGPAHRGRVMSLHMDGLVCDRSWQPEEILRASLSLSEPMGVGRIECLWVPSAPRAMPDLSRCWEAIAFLGDSPVAFGRRAQVEPLETLAQWIGLAADAADPVDQQRIAGLRSVRLSTALSPCASAAPTGWVHTIKVALDIATAHHADHGGWLFGRMVAQALSETVSMNDGMEVELRLDGHAASRHSNLRLQSGSFL